MQISRASDIGLRALIMLKGLQQDHTTVPKLAASLGVPTRYLGKIVHRLTASKWVETFRGRGGGLRISPTGGDATVSEVIRVFEEGRTAVNCTDPLCPVLDQGCRLRGLLIQAEDVFMKSMSKVTIADMA